MTESDHIPERLAAALQRLTGPLPGVPHRIDDTIASAARLRLRRRRPWRHWVPLAAAAAAVLAWFLWRAPGLAGDVDGNGRVDIRDAFALARRLETGTPADPRFDLTGEGLVDRRDVVAIAQRAVALEAGGR